MPIKSAEKLSVEQGKRVELSVKWGKRVELSVEWGKSPLNSTIPSPEEVCEHTSYGPPYSIVPMLLHMCSFQHASHFGLCVTVTSNGDS